jgi:voltage-gated potassium channel
MVAASQAESSSGFRETVRRAFNDPSTVEFRRTSAATVILIFGSVASLILESMALGEPVDSWLAVAETILVLAFTAEYVMHIWVAPDRWKYVKSFWGIVDLLSILPALLAFLPNAGMRVVRTLRVLRVLRMIKLMKLASDQARLSAQRASKQQSSFASDITIYAMALATVLVISSTLAYYSELDVEDTSFSSIPAAMWWAIVTITTTGYGDMVPSTVPGKVVAAATMFAGLALFGILTSVIGRAVMTTLFGRPAEAESESHGESTVRSSRAPAPPIPMSDVAVTVFAIIAVALMVFETLPGVGDDYASWFTNAEYVLVAIFTLDYIRCLYQAPDKRAYAFSIGGIIDLLSILPTYLSLLDVTGLKALRALRVLRVLRVLKLIKLAFAQRAIKAAGEGKSNTFAIDLQIYAIAVLCAITVSGTLGYYAEKDVDGSAFTSIPAGMWWGVVTLTTTGYGDMVTQNEAKLVQPVTAMGRIIGGATMLVGLALFGVLTSVIGRALLQSLFGAPGGGGGSSQNVASASSTARS